MRADLRLDEHDVARHLRHRRCRRAGVRAEDLVDVHDLDARCDHGLDLGDQLRPEDGLDDDRVVLLRRRDRLQLRELLLRIVGRVEHGHLGALRLGDGLRGSEHGGVVAVGDGEREVRDAHLLLRARPGGGACRDAGRGDGRDARQEKPCGHSGEPSASAEIRLQVHFHSPSFKGRCRLRAPSLHD